MMTTTPETVVNMTVEAFEQLLTDFMQTDEYGGAGYIRERFVHRQAWQDSESKLTKAEAATRVEQADMVLLIAAQQRGWDTDQLLQFVNSKHGRWFADELFGNDGRFALKMLEDFEKVDGMSHEWRVTGF